MPKASSRIEPGAVANKRESLSSATQLGHFSVRAAKFTHRVSADGNSDFSSNYELPSSAFVLSVAIDVKEAYDGTVASATIQGQALDPTSLGVKGAAVHAAGSGEIIVDFDANDSTVGEMVVSVVYIDLSEL